MRHRGKWIDDERMKKWLRDQCDEVKGCWLWRHPKNNRGYGSVSYRSKRWYAHRLSFALHHGADLRSDLVCHTCDTPHCINPQHLFRGTQKDNMFPRLHAVARSDEDIPYIRSNPDKKTQWALAKQFGVHQSTIWKIQKGVNRSARAFAKKYGAA